MAKTMRAQVIEEPGKMVLKEVPVPTISDDEVLIKVKMCGICGTDWKIFMGEYAAEHLPMISGHEFWGVIEEVGSNVKDLEVGDRVSVDICMPCGTCYFCRRGEGLLCQTFTQLGIHTDGAFAEYVKAPWQNCYKIPENVDDYSAAFIEPLTAVMQASKKMDCKISTSVVIIGCGLGILHGALARLRGAAPVIVIGDSASKLEMAKKFGADITININEISDPVAEVKRLTNGIGADYVLEAVGTPKTYEQAFEMVRRGGKVEAFGVVPKGKTAALEPYEFVLGEKKVSGSCAGIGNDWGDVINLLAYNRIDPKPLFNMVVPLEELETALHEVKKDRNIIRVFVSPEIKERIYINK
jgi:L-iditol 2-dehydrogenase